MLILGLKALKSWQQLLSQLLSHNLQAGSLSVLFARVSWRRKSASEAARRMGRGKVSLHKSR